MTRLADYLEATAEEIPLADIARTLALGRPHFGTRAVAAIGRHDELIAWLRGGTAPDDGEFADEAREYRRGGDVDWPALCAGTGGRLISLPTYPFAQDRYPAGMDGARARSLDPAQWLVAEHRIGGVALLPGAAMLEFAAAALLPETAGRIESVLWLRPLVVDRPTTLRLTAAGPSGTTSFEAGADGMPPCARGRVTRTRPALPADVDVAAIRGRSTAARDAAGLYAAFAAAGIEYGPSYQVLRELYIGEGEALGRFAVPAARVGELPGRPLHPVVLDGAMQVVAALADAGDRPLLPFALAALEIYGPVPAEGFAHVTGDGGTFTIDVADPAGRVRLRFAGLALRAAPVTGPPDDERLHVLVPGFADAAPVPADVTPAGPVVIFHDPAEAELAAALAAEHRRAGDETVAVPWPGPAESPGLRDCLRSGRRPGSRRDGRPGSGDLRAVPHGTVAARGRRRTGAADVEGSAAQCGVVPGEPIWPAAAGLIGLTGSVAAEQPAWSAGCIDVGDIADPQRAARLLRVEPARERLVLYRDGRRLVRILHPGETSAAPETTTATAPFRCQGSYVIVGGAGGIGAELSRHLAARTRPGWRSSGGGSVTTVSTACWRRSGTSAGAPSTCAPTRPTRPR